MNNLLSRLDWRIRLRLLLPDFRLHLNWHMVVRPVEVTE